MKKILFACFGICSAALFLVNLYKSPQPVQGSVPNGESYSFKVASSSSASATVPYVIRKGTGVLGSITIASSSLAATVAFPVRVYDSAVATTSSASSTLITTIKPGTSEQTLTFDAAVSYGILMDIPAGFNGVYTVTYR